ncbi:MAG: hypothetical protein MUC43_06915 [Pirellula sp.]|jgi:hypothetical protein|nr:hypothetical protein [Pirellula sp.]
MRRMMHAITVPLLFSSIAVAQDLPGPVVHATPAPVVVPSVESTAITAPTEFYPTTSGQPYSALTSYMMCHDNCKDFWAGYSAERAAIASRLCKECKHRHCHGHQGCATGCSTGCSSSGCVGGGSAGCDAQSGCGPVPQANHVANRYQQSWSTLYGVADTRNGSSATSGSGVALASRTAPNATGAGAKMSLLVPGQVVSPYLKARQPTQGSVTAHAGWQPGVQSAAPVYKQATMPPASGSWAR